GDGADRGDRAGAAASAVLWPLPDAVEVPADAMPLLRGRFASPLGDQDRKRGRPADRPLPGLPGLPQDLRGAGRGGAHAGRLDLAPPRPARPPARAGAEGGLALRSGVARPAVTGRRRQWPGGVTAAMDGASRLAAIGATASRKRASRVAGTGSLRGNFWLSGVAHVR